MTITEILGVFGALTGFASLMLHLKNFLAAKPNIRIIFTAPETNVCFKGNLAQDGYIHDGRCIIYIRLENLSSSSITVTEFRLSSSVHKETFVSNAVTKASGSYEVLRWAESSDKKYSFICKIEDDHLLPPIEIPAYGVKNGCIFFVMSKPEPFHGELTVVTPTKIFEASTDINLPTPVNKFHTKITS